jgi:hypothetical protein
MGLLDKLRRPRRDRQRSRGRSGKKLPRQRRDETQSALPGGASQEEAAAASPQRAAELAD